MAPPLVLGSDSPVLSLLASFSSSMVATSDIASPFPLEPIVLIACAFLIPTMSSMDRLQPTCPLICKARSSTPRSVRT